ncbi:hypothetical protein VUR80DRAFT_929 [Thermomyces stellatus]
MRSDGRRGWRKVDGANLLASPFSDSSFPAPRDQFSPPYCLRLQDGRSSCCWFQVLCRLSSSPDRDRCVIGRLPLFFATQSHRTLRGYDWILSLNPWSGAVVLSLFANQIAAPRVLNSTSSLAPDLQGVERRYAPDPRDGQRQKGARRSRQFYRGLIREPASH